MQPLMLGLNPATGQAPLYIPGYLPLHTRQQVAQSQVPIHLGGPQMNRKTRLMSLLQHSLPDPTRNWNPNPFTLGQQPSTIHDNCVNLSLDRLLLLGFLMKYLGLSLPDQSPKRRIK